MANAEAWSQGWAMGRERADERRAHKQALSDQELEGKITQLIDNRKAIQAKLPTLLDEKGNPTPEYTQAVDALTQNARDLREVYHPERQPGAIQRFGHLLTDALHLSSPQERQQKQAAQQAAGNAQDVKTAQGLAAAAPVSPEQDASRKYIAQVNAQMKAIDSSGMSEDDKARAKEAIFKIYAKPNNIWVDLPDGSTVLADKNDPDSVPPGAKPHLNPTAGNTNLAQYNQGIADGTIPPGTSYLQWSTSQKPVTSKFGMNVESYRKLHNIPAGQPLTPDQLNFVEQQIALSSAAPSTNITTSLKQDVNGMWVPVTEANRRIPGFGVILSDPLASGKGSPSGTSSPSSTPKSATPSTHGAKKETTPSSNPNTKVGTPLFQGRTPEIDTAQKDVIAATKVDSLAKQALASHEAVQQRQLALAMIRGMAGRVNMQEFQQYTTKMGVENTVDGMIKGIENGQLPDGIVQQLANAAHANLKAAQDALKVAVQGIGTSSEGQTGDADIDAIVKALSTKKAQ